MTLVSLAGAETWCDLFLELGVKNSLLSYFYLRDKLKQNRVKTIGMLNKLRLHQRAGYNFILDSGAFTYQARQSQKKPVPTPEEYFEEYRSFVLEWADVFHIIAELDVDGYAKHADGKYVQTATVDAWTNKLAEDLGFKECHRLLPTYHAHRGKQWLKDCLLDTTFPLIGHSSAIGAVSGSPALIAQCHEFGKFIHGFGQTRIKTDMKYTHYDSVDSSTWLRADKYGGTCIFKDGKFIVLDHTQKAQRALYRGWYESWGLDFSKIFKDDLHENRKATIIAWRELSNNYEAKRLANSRPVPYIYAMRKRGVIPVEHPMITAKKKQKASVDTAQKRG